MAGAEGLEPSARGFGAAQKWYYLVSPNAAKSKKHSNYQQSQDFVTLNNIQYIVLYFLKFRKFFRKIFRKPLQDFISQKTANAYYSKSTTKIIEK